MIRKHAWKIRSNLMGLSGKMGNIAIQLGILPLFGGTSLANYFSGLDTESQNAIRSLYACNEINRDPSVVVAANSLKPSDMTPARILSSIPDICIPIFTRRY